MGSACVKTNAGSDFDDVQKSNQDFRAWARERSIKKTAIKLLQKQDLDDKKALKDVTDEELRGTGITVGQIKRIRQAIDDDLLDGGKREQTVEERYTEPPAQPKTKQRSKFRAMLDFTAQENDELDLKRGDVLELIDVCNIDGWHKVKHMGTGKTGFAPIDCLTSNMDDITAYEWWFDMSRIEATKQLLPHENGTFLVRNCSKTDAKFVLTVKWCDEEHPKGVVHYKIKLTNDGKYHTSQKKHFASVSDLIKYYKENPGLCGKLLKPCPKEAAVVPFKEIEIDRKSIELFDELGKGNFGVVHKGKWKNKRDVAVKSMNRETTCLDDFLKEAKFMHKLHHRRLVQLLGICSTDEPFYIVSELMIGCLRNHLIEFGKKNISFTELINMAAQIADGMSYLEGQNFVHRDLRAANILVAKDNTVKVSDFGLARMLDEGAYKASGSKYPLKWTAIEAINKQIFTPKSDVWSFGVLMYELLTYGNMPYPGMKNKVVIEKLTKENYRMEVPEEYYCPDDVYEKMLQCWDNDPEKRPSFAILALFFTKYNFVKNTGSQDDESDSDDEDDSATVDDDGGDNEARYEELKKA